MNDRYWLLWTSAIELTLVYGHFVWAIDTKDERLKSIIFCNDNIFYFLAFVQQFNDLQYLISPDKFDLFYYCIPHTQ